MNTIGIVGTGIIGERIIQQIQQEDGIEIRIIFDEQTERMKLIGEKYGIPTAASLEEVLHEDIDWIYIGTPPASHLSIADKAASAGINVLSEKPLAHNVEDGESMVQSVKENQIQSAMNFPLMYSPSVHEMAKRIKTGSIGKVLRIELQTHFPVWPRPWQQNPWIASRSQGGFVREVFPHYLQLIHRLFGDWTILSHQIEYPEDQEKCETGIIAHGKTEEGTPILLTGLSGSGQKELLQFHVYGEEGVLTLENWSQLYESNKGEERQPVTGLDPVSTLFKELNAQATTLVPFEEGLAVQRYIDQLLNS